MTKPTEDQSVLDGLWRNVEERPEQTALSSGPIDADGAPKALVDYVELGRRVRSAAAHLADRGISSGDRVVVMLPNGIDYVVAVMAAMAAGAIPVPLFPPDASTHSDRVESVMLETRPDAVFTTAKALPRVEELLTTLRQLGCAVLDEAAVAEDRSSRFAPATPNDVAFLQYTSGSTSTPKGVMVTQPGLLANIDAIRHSFGHTAGDVGVCWLPLFHDMGLVGSVLNSVHGGGHLHLMQPSDLLRRPAGWLTAISALGAHTSGGPNFAFDWCVDKIKDEQMEGIDLSSWQVAYNGSEAIHRRTIDRFVERFEPWGFSRSAMLPCYGLAEFTLLVSSSSVTNDAMMQSFSPQALAQGRAEPDENGRVLVASGAPVEGRSIRIVADDGAEANPGGIGQILVAGPDRAAGYWRNAAASQVTFGLGDDDPFPGYLRTGDVGFLHDGLLFVTGRIKEMIVVRGKNLYPADVEDIALDTFDVSSRLAAAAFPIASEKGEMLGIAIEISNKEEDLGSITRQVRLAVAEKTGIQPRAIALVRKRSLPKTSSGKLRRVEIGEQFARSELDVLHLDEMIIGEGTRERPELATPYRRPDDGLEQTVATVWSSVLQISDIGADDDFLALGGDSLDAAQIAVELGSVFGVTVELSDLFATHTIGEVAAMIAGEMGPQDNQDDDLVEVEL